MDVEHQSEAGFAWFRRVALLCLAASVLLGIVCLANGARRVGRTFPGFLVAENGIVLSVARSGWPVTQAKRIFFAKIIRVGGELVRDGSDVQARAAGLAPGTPVTYDVREGLELFRESLPVVPFTLSDFLSIYVSYFLVALCFAAAALWVIMGEHPAAAARFAFLLLCLATSVTLFTGGDVYGPYWFTAPYFIAHALTPAALFHLAASYPVPIGAGSVLRRFFLVALYALSIALGLVLVLRLDEPSVFLPLLYTVYLLLANALFLYIARLVIAYWSGASDTAPHLWRALAAVLASGTLAGGIFVVYPALHRPISPLALVLPLAIFPLLTGAALRRAPLPQRRAVSIRSRLSLLLLGAMETTFLVGVGMFWLNETWQRLLDDSTLHQERIARVSRLSSAPPARLGRELAALDREAQTFDEHQLITAARAAVAEGERPSREVVRSLLDRYAIRAEDLSARKEWLTRISGGLVIVLVLVGLLHAVGFMIVIRRWLIAPMEQISEATAVIATGNLSHRVDHVATEEFATLGRAIDGMAESLAAIQRRIERERAARRNAAGAARDLERRRLARELHDGALQNLSGLKYGLEGELKIPGTTGLHHLLDGVTKCITELRSIVDDLRVPDLVSQPLADAIAAHARALSLGRDVALDLDLAQTPSLAPWAMQDVYRVAQEAIANAVKHGDPERLAVRLVEHDGAVQLEVSDDGKGFDPAATQPGNGLVGMRERAAALGADLHIESAPGAGTTIRLDVPKTENGQRA